MKTRILLAGLPALLFASAAQAQVSVSVWTGQPTAAGDATIAQAGTLGAADLTTTVSGINFTDAPFTSDATTVGYFLGNPLLSSATLNNSYFLFTGSIYLDAGVNNFTIAHDDGVQISLDGGLGMVLDDAGPTSPTTTPFAITASTAGTYNYTLSYGECCGGPAVLQWLYPSGAPVGEVPEPATWAMMVLGFAGIGMIFRGRRRNQDLLSQVA